MRIHSDGIRILSERKGQLATILIAVSLFLSQQVAGQGIAAGQVTLVTSVNAPYNVPLSQLKNQVTITMTAVRAFVENGYLTVQIQGDNGVIIQSNLSVLDQTINISDGQTIMLQGQNGDLDGVFQQKALNFTGTTASKVFNNGLPPGNYQVCFRVWQNAQQPESPPPPQGCGVFSVQGIANATVTTQVLPPYGTDFSNYSGNTQIFVQSPGYNGNFSLFLHITGDNGVNLTTRPDYVPNDINIKNATPVSPIDLASYFNPSNLVSSGIPISDIFINGLPEGKYQVCVRIKDPDGNFVSPDEPGGCSNQFDIRYSDPPVAVNPVCGDTLRLPAQNIVFSWTPSPGAPAFTSYTLKIVEMLDPNQDPNEAMLTATVPAFFESTVSGALSFYYGPNRPILEPGRKYAWQVIAEDKETNTKFRNEGKSEVCSFVWSPINLTPNYGFNETGLTFNMLTPDGKIDSIRISNQQDFYVSWGWLFNGNFFKSDSLKAYRDLGVTGYNMTIRPATGKSGRLTDPAFSYQLFIPAGDSTGQYAGATFQRSAAALEKIGMKNDYWYNVEVTAVNKSKATVATAKTQDFRLVINKIKKGLAAHVSGQLQYKFDGFPDRYPIANTSIRFYPAENLKTSIPGVNKNTIPPAPQISTDDYYTTTDAQGKFRIDIPLTSIQDTTKNYRLEIESHYYKPVDSVYRFTDLTDTVKLGPIRTTAYNYTLKLYLAKSFGSYKIAKDNSYYDYHTDKIITEIDTVFEQAPDSLIQDMPAGIDVILYRKQKPSYIPGYEGQYGKPVNENGLIKIGEGKTATEIGKNGQKACYVKFEKLLCNVFNNDEYYYKAVNPKQKGVNGQPESYTDGNFEAPEEELRFEKPPSSGDSTHFEITRTYKIISKDPPKSTISGQLVYSWPGDNSNTLRPLAFEKFSVVVEYLYDGNPVQFFKPVANGAYVTTLQMDNGQGKLFTDDNGQVMATGTTDANGRFSLQAVNLNDKGVLGKGTSTTSGGPKPPNIQPHNGPSNPLNMIVSPDDQSFITDISDMSSGAEGGTMFNFEDMSASFGAGAQTNLLNGSMNNGPGAAMQNQIQGLNIMPKDNESSFGSLDENLPDEVASIHGPNPSGNSDYYAQEEIRRVYRIRLADQDLYYNPEQNITVQPLETVDAGPITVMVKEVNFKFSVKEKGANNTPEGLKAVIFRDPSSKIQNLPQGEGDGKYRMKKLINPKFSGEVNISATQQNNHNNTGGTGSYQTGNWKQNINGYTYNNEATSEILGGKQSWAEGTYEWLEDSATASDGSVAFGRLDGGFKDYYLEVASNPTTGHEYFFKPALIPLNSSVTNIVYKENSDHFAINTGTNTSYGNYWDTRQVDIPQASVQVEMSPQNSRAGGRVIDKSSGKGLPYAVVTVTDSATHEELGKVPSDSAGYFELLNVYNLVKPPPSSANITVTMQAKYPGYKQQGFKKGTVSKEGRQYIDNILMVPAATIAGYIKNKAGVPVDAYIKRTDGLTVETLGFKVGRMILKSNVGKFSLPVPVNAGGTAIFYVIPKDPGYFTDTVVVKNMKEGVNNIGTHTVYRRMHHLHFYISDQDNNSVKIAGAMITINKKDSAKTNSSGEATFDFENVSINNYTLVVKGPAGKGYIPKVINLKNEESKTEKNYSIKLKKGGSVSGTVTLDGAPIAGARIYLDYKEQNSFQITGFYVNFGTNQNSNQPANTQQLNNSSLPQIATRSDDQGHYQLVGIPVSSGSVTVYASLDTTFTVIGDHRTVTLIDGKALQDLAMKSDKNLLVQSIYGFPLTVESLTPTKDPNVMNVTGIVRLNQSSSPFTWINNQKEIRIRNIPFTKKKVNGKTIGTPVNDQAGLDAVSSLKMQYLGKYNVLITAGNQSNVNELTLNRDNNNKGQIMAYVHIVDNSFNYPSSYLNFQNKDQFYLGDVAGNKVNNLIQVFNSLGTDAAPVLNPSAGQLLSTHSYHLSNGQGKAINFNFIQFDATADPLNSYIATDGKIHLAVNMNCTIPHAQPDHFTVNAGDVVLDNGKVYPAKGAKPLEVQLEKWKLEVSNWTIDPKQGGIYSEKGLIRTGKLDIPFTEFNLRPDMFVMKGFQLNNLMLGGGVKKLSDISTGNANIFYDTKSGSDMSGHWKLAIAGVGAQPAARILGFGNYLNKEIDIDYIELLSNNEDIFTLHQTADPYIINGNGLARFSPQSINSGPDYFTVTGGLAIPAPRLTPMMMSLVFTRPNSNLNMKINPVQMSFEGKGYVDFTADQSYKPEITGTKITIKGQVEEKNGFNPITATFYADGNDPSSGYYHVDLQKGFVLNLTSGVSKAGEQGKYNLKIDHGGMEVKKGASDWGLLSYSGFMLTDDPTISEQSNMMTFTVHGDIDVSSDEVNVSNVKLPFGTLNMVYLFPEKTLRGTLDVDKQKLGTFTIGGKVEMLMDPKGWYFLGACKVNTGVPGPFSSLNMGFLLGNRSFSVPEMQIVADKVTQFSYSKNSLCWLKNGGNSAIRGFFITAGKNLMDNQLGVNLGVASIYLEATAGGEASLYAKFDPWAINMSAGLYGKVVAGAAALNVTLNGSASLDGSLTGSVGENEMCIGGKVEASIFGSGDVDLEVKDLTFSFVKHAVVKLILSNNSGISTDFYFGTAPPPACDSKSTCGN